MIICAKGLIAQEPLFTLLTPGASGINFRNDVTENKNINIFKEWQNYVYSGAGVATGDVNNDGLIDIFFAGNMTSSKLYINKGQLKFEDVSSAKGIITNNWCTGVTMADINNDGWLDIFVSSYGYPDLKNARCWLFENQKNGKFVEKAEKYGLLNRGANVSQSSFFDYDNDGDMDIYLTVYPTFDKDVKREMKFDFEDKNLPIYGNDKLYENLGNGKFSDVSESAGIQKENAYGLSILTTDINNDGLIDIYVANDFDHNDFLYINQGNKTFKESIKKYFDHTAFYSMGTDIGDINGDIYPDIIELDMNPESNQKYKVDFNEFSFDIYKQVVKKFMRQEIRNNVQINNGDGTYNESGQSLGMDLTDWSWTPLIKDFNLDGSNDVFVTNGIKKYILNSSYFYWQYDSILKSKGKYFSEDIDRINFINTLPDMLLPNYMFISQPDYTFKNLAKESGLSQLTASNGAAYADFDGDGDDDLVLNNMDDFGYVYRNNSANTGLNYFSFKLVNNKKIPIDNAKYYLYTEGKKYYYETTNQRGFYSSSDRQFNVGIGNAKAVDSLVVILPQNKYFTIVNPSINKINIYTIPADNNLKLYNYPTVNKIFSSKTITNIEVQENDYIDYKYQPVLLQLYSKMGPGAAFFKDPAATNSILYLGGAKGKDKYLYKFDNQFNVVDKTLLPKERTKENTAALFFDANKDSHEDLLVASGSGQWGESAANLGASLYMGDFKGGMIKDTTFPIIAKHITKILSLDYDKDGNVDIVLFPMPSPEVFPTGETPIFIKNTGKGFVIDTTIAKGAGGIYTDAEVLDWNNDGLIDFVALGHWMSPEIWINTGNNFVVQTLGDSLKGYWSAVDVFDTDNDGIAELFLGNIGNNWRYNLTGEDSLLLWDVDFNSDGVKDPIVCTVEKGLCYPIYLHGDFVKNYPYTKKYVLNQVTYSTADIKKIFPSYNFETAKYRVCNFQKSITVKKSTGGKVTVTHLPNKVQESPVNKFTFTNSGDKSLMLAFGQNKEIRDEIGPMDASKGMCFEFLDNKWNYITGANSGICIKGEVKDVLEIDTNYKLIITKETAPVLLSK